MERVSIVLPTHNGARYLRQSLDSCLDQSYANIELIVVDDASSDETPAILESYDEPRLRVVRHEHNRRLPASLNTGFLHTLGKYLTWTSDDNYYAPGAIARLVQFLDEHPGVDFVYSRCWLVNEQGEIIGERRAGPPEDLREYNCVGACFLYRREVYEAIGDYSAKVALSEDYEYWLRVMQRFRLAFLDEPLYYYRQHDQSLTATDYGNYRAQRLALRLRRQYFGLAWRTYATEMASHFIAEAFDSYNRRDMGNVWRAAVLGLLYNASWLRNRGLLSILIHAAAGDRGVSLLRAAATRLGWRTRSRPSAGVE